MQRRCWVYWALVFVFLVTSCPAAAYAGYETGGPSIAWQRGENLSRALRDGTAFVLGDMLYYAGGRDAGGPVDMLQAARLVAGKPEGWRNLGPLHGGARFGASVVVHRGRAYVAGGYTDGPVDWIYSFDGSLWRRERNLPAPLNLPGVAVLNNRMYVTAGYPLPGVTIWSAAFDTYGMLGEWRVEAGIRPDLSTRLAAWESCLFAVGGKIDTNNLVEVNRDEVYRAEFASDGAIAGWTSVARLPLRLALHEVVVRDDMLYVLGGETLAASGDALTTSSGAFAAKIDRNCNLAGWQVMKLPEDVGRQRTAAAVSGRGLYLAGGEASTGSYRSDTWYHILPWVNLTLHSEPRTKLAGGDTVTYLVDYKITGNGTLENVRIINKIPPEVGLVEGSANPSSGSYEAGAMTWMFGTVDREKSGTLSYQARVPCRQGTITAAVYEDLNGDGQRQINEPSRNNVTVQLYRGGTLVAAGKTDSTGFYAFRNLNLGSYQIRVLTPAGSVPTTPVVVETAVRDEGVCQATESFGVHSCYPLSTAVDPPNGGQIERTPPNCQDANGAMTLYQPGTDVVIVAKARPGYSFAGWTGDVATASHQLTIRMDAPKSLRAGFNACYPLATEVFPPGAGQVTVSLPPNCEGGGKDLYNPGARVQLSAAAAPDFAFAKWSGSTTGTNSAIEVIMDGGKTAAALFAHCLSVTTGVDVAPPGVAWAQVTTAPNCPGGGSKYAPGSTVTIATGPEAGNPYALFRGWHTDRGTLGDPSQPTTSLTLGSVDATVTASYDTCKKLDTAAYPNEAGAVSLLTAPNCGADRYLPGTQVMVQAEPAVGQHFQGWTGDASGSANPFALVMNADQSVTALFETNCYALSTTTEPSGGGEISVEVAPNCPDQTARFLHGTTVTVTARPGLNHAFWGWGGDTGGLTMSARVVMDGNKNVLAQFAACQPLAISVNPAGAGMVAASPLPNCQGGSLELYNPGTTVELRAEPGLDHAFAGWTGSAGGTVNPVGVVIDSAKAVTASFERCVALNVAVDPPTAGTAVISTAPNCPGGGDGYLPGSKVILTTSRNAYHVFDGWDAPPDSLSDPQTPGAILTVPAEDTTVVARYATCNVLSAAVNPPDSGTVNVDPAPNCDGTHYVPDTVLELSAVPGIGWAFLDWSGTITGTTNPLTLTMNGNYDVTASFETACYALTAVAAPEAFGSLTVLPAPDCVGHPGLYTHGTVVTLSPEPATGRTFAYWEGDATGTTSPITVTMNSQRVVTGTFETACYAVSTQVDPPDAGSVGLSPDPNCETQAGLYSYGTAITVTAAAASGYAFDSWDGTEQSAANPLALTVTAPVSLIGVFTPTMSSTAVPPPTPALRWQMAMAPISNVVLNRGVSAEWWYNGVRYEAHSNWVSDGATLYLPSIIRETHR